MKFKILKLDEQKRVIVEVNTKFGKDTWSLDLPHTKLTEDGEVAMSPEDYKGLILAKISQFEAETEAIRCKKEEIPSGIEKMIGKGF